MRVTIYHNPACGTSRNTLAMIRQNRFADVSPAGLFAVSLRYLSILLSRQVKLEVEMIRLR
jgi:hypothetical protein